MVDDIKLSYKDKRSAGVETESEPSFTPPEIIAQEEDAIDMASSDKDSKALKDNGKKRPKKKSKIKAFFEGIGSWWRGLSKKKKALVVVLGLLLVALLSFGAYALLKPEPKPAPVAKEEVKEVPPPTTEASKLTGVEVPIGTNKKPIIGVMIENSPDARPQASLNEAGVVFEAVAEGGITRFLVLHLDNEPAYVGPVRSVRPYYLQWLQAFDAPISHAGGSGEALAKIRNEGIPDLDHGGNGAYYQRVSNRYAPHNLYTSLPQLLELSGKKGFTGANTKSLLRKAEAPTAAPTAKTISIVISSAPYNVTYAYEAATNSYLRAQGGAPHTDEKSGQQIKPKVVVALAMSKGVAANRIHTTYATIGSGTAFIFQDGTVTQATWTKTADKEQLRFTDAAGTEIGLNPGQTWFSVVSLVSSVTYTP